MTHKPSFVYRITSIFATLVCNMELFLAYCVTVHLRSRTPGEIEKNMALRTWHTAGAKTRSGRTSELIEEDERQPMTLSASTSRSTGERPNSELENAGPSTSTSPRSTESRQSSSTSSKTVTEKSKQNPVKRKINTKWSETFPWAEFKDGRIYCNLCSYAICVIIIVFGDFF